MSWIDWAIVIVPMMCVLFLGYYSSRYIRGVADFLAAGRVCGRYVICIASVDFKEMLTYFRKNHNNRE